jgi:hypothetical protein
MNNYTIDASIYLIPDVNNLSLGDKTKKYREFINRIKTLQKTLQPFKNDMKLYFFQKDIKLLINTNKLFTKEILNELRELKLGKKYNSQLNDLYDFYLRLIDNLKKRGYDVSGPIYSKYITIESHLEMNINNINIGNIPIYEPDIENISYNASILNLFKKKILLLAFLNKYIYLNSGINKLLCYPEIPHNELKLTVEVNEVTHQFLTDEIPKTNFVIDKQTIYSCKFDNSTIQRKNFDTIDQAYLKAKEDFCETLVFSIKVKESIENYNDTMSKLSKLMPDNPKIQNHVRECPYTLYDHLDSLDKLVNYYRNTRQIPINKREPILNKFKIKNKDNDKSTCYSKKELVCRKCSAFLRFCRYDCSGETATEGRIIDGKLYQIHLKQYKYGKNGPNKDIADLTLRIYFRWDDDKIQVGYIGKHLP